MSSVPIDRSIPSSSLPGALRSLCVTGSPRLTSVYVWNHLVASPTLSQPAYESIIRFAPFHPIPGVSLVIARDSIDSGPFFASSTIDVSHFLMNRYPVTLSARRESEKGMRLVLVVLSRVTVLPLEKRSHSVLRAIDTPESVL